MTVSPPATNADAPPPTAAERPGLTVRGPWVVAATLSLFVVVPVVAVTIMFFADDPVVADDSAQQPAGLVWAERDAWPRTFYTTFKSLERGPMSSARTNKTYNEKLSPVLDPAEQLAVVRCTELALNPPDVFLGVPTRAALEAEIEDRPDLFYAHYLLATWHAAHGDPHAAEPHFAAAFRHAPAALIQRHATPAGTDAAGVELPPYALAVDRIIDDRLDRSTVLVYPFVRTDAQGMAYLPVYKAILRHADLDRLDAWIDVRQKPKWFTFAGDVGRLPDRTITP
ncbi:MAG: hypothetical protein AAFX76_02910 [Planctomycetota bacterium]